MYQYEAVMRSDPLKELYHHMNNNFIYNIILKVFAQFVSSSAAHKLGKCFCNISAHLYLGTMRIPRRG